MEDNRNMELTDDTMAGAAGGENSSRPRYEYGRVTGFFENWHMNRWSVTLTMEER